MIIEICARSDWSRIASYLAIITPREVIIKSCPNGKCLATKHDQTYMLMLNQVAKRCQTCLIKQRSNPSNKRYLWIQVKERAQNACARKTCLTKPSKRTKCFTMFDQIFDDVQILSNTIKHDQTRSNKVSKRENVWPTNNV